MMGASTNGRDQCGDRPIHAWGGAMTSKPTTRSRAQTLVLALRLVTELALVAGAAWAASTRPRNVLVAVALGVVAALAVAAVWSLAIAPASRRRLADPLRLAVEIALFVAVAVGLAAVGHLPAAAVLALVGVGAAVGVRFVDRPQPEPSGATAATEPANESPITGEQVDAEQRPPAPVRPPPEPDVPHPPARSELKRPRGRDRARRN
jgi:hypothetical protein